MPNEVHDSTVVQDDVPREYDKIQILFRLPDVGLVWWPTTVLSSREHNVPGTIKGTAKVEYSTFHSYKNTCEEVQFLGGRTVNTGMGETPWRTSAEAADAGAGNGEEAEWNENGRKSKGAENASTTAVEDDEPADLGCTPELAQAQDAAETPRKRARRRRNETQRTHRLSRYPELSSGTQQGSTRSGTFGAETLEYLTCRVSALEHAYNDRPDRAIREFKTNFVQDKADMWRMKLLCKLKAPVKKPKPTRMQYFGSVLRGDAIWINETFTLEWFSWVVENIATTIATKPPRRVQFLPSLSGLRNATEDIAEGHVLFDDARTMFTWLGLTSPADVNNQMVRCQARNNEDTARILGGVQWSEGVQQNPLTCFIGRSCVRNVKEREENQGNRVEVIQFPTARWDSSNNAFASEPSIGSACVGRFGGNEELTSAFRISWRWKQEYNGRGVSLHGRRGGFSKVGELTIYIPTITVIGKTLISVFNEVVGNENVGDGVDKAT